MMRAVFLLVLLTFYEFGCARRHTPELFVHPEPVSMAETTNPNRLESADHTAVAEVPDRPQLSYSPVTAPKIVVVSPRPRVRVPQFGAQVRFIVRGDIPIGTQLIVFIRDGTGLESNWWPFLPHPVDPRQPRLYSCEVQFGESDDSGHEFVVLVLSLRDEETPAVGQVGALPLSPVAASLRVPVIRE